MNIDPQLSLSSDALEPDDATSSAQIARETAALLKGAVVGGAAVALAAWIQHRRREYRRPVRRLERALSRLPLPRRPSPLARVARAAGAVLVSTLTDFARERMQAMIAERMTKRAEPESNDALEIPLAPVHSPLAPPALPTMMVAPMMAPVPPAVAPEPAPPVLMRSEV